MKHTHTLSATVLLISNCAALWCAVQHWKEDAQMHFNAGGSAARHQGNCIHACPFLLLPFGVSSMALETI